VLSTAMALAVAALVAVPSAWAASVLDARYGGSAFDASAGPAARVGFGGGGPRMSGGQAFGPGGSGPVPTAIGQGSGAPFGDMTDTLTAEQRRLDDYLVAHRGGARFLAAMTSWNSAGPYIMATGRAYLPMGGFSGNVPQPTLAAVQGMIARGELHYLLLPRSGDAVAGPGFGGDRMGATTTAIAAWVRSSCAAVTDDVGSTTEVLYRCA
jgi:hypothetical protein